MNGHFSADANNHHDKHCKEQGLPSDLLIGTLVPPPTRVTESISSYYFVCTTQGIGGREKYHEFTSIT